MIKQNTPEWEKLRKGYIGASDAPIIMQCSPWKTPFQLWEEKMGIMSPQKMSYAMKRGHDLESGALALYNELTGRDASPLVVFSEEYPWMMASLDGVSLDGSRIVEIKAPGKTDHLIARSGNIPEKYKPQLQHQLATYGLDSADYFSYVSNDDYALVHVNRDEQFIKEMLEKERAFWECMQTFEAPPLTDRDYVDRQDDQWSSVAAQWMHIQDKIKSLEETEKEYRKLLIEMAGDQNTHGGGVRVQKILRKGAVNYKAIPELQGVDLNKFRKAPTLSWRFSRG